VTNLINVRYLTGYTGSEGTLLVTPRTAVFFSDFRYKTQAAKQVKGARVNIFTDKNKAIAREVVKFKIKRMGFEGDVMTVNQRAAVAKACKGVKLVALGGDVNDLRLVKEPGEIDALREVIALSEKALKKLYRKLQPGITEIEFARTLEIEMIKLGAEGFAFETIVASGPRGALPHGVAADKKMKKGELVVIDYGAVLNGYHSDQTVTRPIGKVSSLAKKIYNIVYDAQGAAIDACKAGMTGAQLDKVARDVIHKAGYGKYFGHGLGHGVGLEIHEGPRASQIYKGTLEAGMVVTIEPGIYLPGKLGVRHEDMVLVTDTGCELLTTIDKRWKW
jgi:Xaa-Pro aminopeptidase